MHGAQQDLLPLDLIFHLHILFKPWARLKSQNYRLLVFKLDNKYIQISYQSPNFWLIFPSSSLDSHKKKKLIQFTL